MKFFNRNLALGYGLSLLLLFLSAAASVICIQNLLNGQRMVNHTNEVIKKLDGIMVAVREAEAGQRGYLLSNNEEYLALYRDALTRAGSNLDAVRRLTVDNPAQQRSTDELKVLLDERFGLMQH